MLTVCLHSCNVFISLFRSLSHVRARGTVVARIIRIDEVRGSIPRASILLHVLLDGCFFSAGMGCIVRDGETQG